MFFNNVGDITPKIIFMNYDKINTLDSKLVLVNKSSINKYEINETI